MIQIDLSRCIRCGACAGICVQRSIVMTEEGPRQTGGCISCGHCFAVCPRRAILVADYDCGDTLEREERPARNPEEMLRRLRFRRSIRRYQDRLIPHGELERLIEAGRYSVCGANSQKVFFTVVERTLPHVREMIWEEVYRSALAHGNEPVLRRYEEYRAHPEEPDGLLFGGKQLLVISARNPGNGWIAAANIDMMAQEMGLGSLFCGFAAFGIERSAVLQAELGLDGDEHKLVTCLVLGYPDVEFLRTPPRKKREILWR